MITELGKPHLGLAARNEDRFCQPSELFATLGLDLLGWEIDSGLFCLAMMPQSRKLLTV